MNETNQNEDALLEALEQIPPLVESTKALTRAIGSMMQNLAATKQTIEATCSQSSTTEDITKAVESTIDRALKYKTICYSKELNDAKEEAVNEVVKKKKAALKVFAASIGYLVLIGIVALILCVRKIPSSKNYIEIFQSDLVTDTERDSLAVYLRRAIDVNELFYEHPEQMRKNIRHNKEVIKQRKIAAENADEQFLHRGEIWW